MKRRLLCSMLLTSALALGCGASSGHGDESSAGDDARQVVELFAWWIAPGEAEALQALVDVHKVPHANARIFNSAADSGTNARDLLKQRLADGDPPDLFQENAHDIRAFLAENPGKLLPLDDFFKEQGLDKAVLSEVIENVTIDGKIYSMPVNLHRENTLFYNKAIFAQHKLTPPTTLDELQQVCATLKAAGVTPIATAHQNWILRNMFNSIAMASMGTTKYHDYFTGKAPRDDAAFRAAVELFGSIIENYTNPDAADEGFGWTNAAQSLYNGDAAMFMHGDWTKGYLVQLGWTPNVDFGVVPAPGTSDLFYYGVDVFALPVGADNERGAREFLATIGSKDGQVAFNELKGSSPIRLDVPKDGLDAVSLATLQDLEKARTRMFVRGKDAWDNAILAYVKNKDVDALMKVYADIPPDH